MATIRRLFGIATDSVSGGSKYEDLTSGAIPDATDLWPVTSSSYDKNQTNIDRNDEVLGVRGRTAPESFRQDPRMTVRMRQHPRLVKAVVAKGFGTTDSVTGTAPAARTHLLKPLGYGAAVLPAVHAQLVRDDENRKMSGAAIKRLTLDFPHDDDGTIEIELWGLYSAPFVAAAPTLTPNAADLAPQTFKLRDVKAYFGSAGTGGTAVPNLSGFTLSYDNMLIDDTEVRYLAGRNVVSVLDANSVKHKIWYPSENRIDAVSEVSGNLKFNSVVAAEEVKNDLAVAEKLVIECYAGDLATTPTAVETMRITVFNKVLTGGGPDDLAKSGALKSSYDFGGFLDASQQDIQVEFVDNSSTPLA